MPDDRPDNVQPTPDLAELAVKPAPAPAEDDTGRDPADPPAEDLTLPTE